MEGDRPFNPQSAFAVLSQHVVQCLGHQGLEATATTSRQHVHRQQYFAAEETRDLLSAFAAGWSGGGGNAPLLPSRRRPGRDLRSRAGRLGLMPAPVRRRAGSRSWVCGSSHFVFPKRGVGMSSCRHVHLYISHHSSAALPAFITVYPSALMWR